jgi:hypothetical protein
MTTEGQGFHFILFEQGIIQIEKAPKDLGGGGSRVFTMQKIFDTKSCILMHF